MRFITSSPHCDQVIRLRRLRARRRCGWLGDPVEAVVSAGIGSDHGATENSVLASEPETAILAQAVFVVYLVASCRSAGVWRLDSPAKTRLNSPHHLQTHHQTWSV